MILEIFRSRSSKKPGGGENFFFSKSKDFELEPRCNHASTHKHIRYLLLILYYIEQFLMFLLTLFYLQIIHNLALHLFE